MNRQKFIDCTGEDPVDLFGPDWENEIHDLSDDEVPEPGDEDDDFDPFEEEE